MSLSSIISKWLRPTSWENLNVRVDINATDQRINLMPKRQSILPGIAIGIVVAGIGIYEAIDNLGDLASLVFSAVFVVGGICLSAWSLILMLSKRVAVFGNDAVEVTGNSMFGTEQWREPYSGYKGVLHREKSVSQGQNDGAILYQIIELKHDDPTKTIPLIVEKSGNMPRQAWEAYAKWLHLPAMTTIEGETTTRDLEDLDKSIAELAADGKIATRLDFSDKPPPKGLHVASESTEDDQSLRVNITVPRAHIAVRLLICGVPALIGLTLAIIGMGTSNTLLATVGGLGTILFIVLGIEWTRRDNRARRDILITRTNMVITDPWQDWPLHQKSFGLSEIETITLQPRGGGLMIAGDQTQVDIGAGLSNAALIWLKEYLTSAVATA